MAFPNSLLLFPINHGSKLSLHFIRQKLTSS
jgi:hypothetical protein